MSDSLNYRPSASTIIAAKTKGDKIKGNQCNYKILVFKRTKATSFAENHCVFPGGSLDSHADESIEWLEYFQESGFTLESLNQLDTRTSKTSNPLLKSETNLSRAVSLRITAIRETFEEVGVLICCRKDSQSSQNKLYGNVEDQFNREYWQNRVHKNANEFLKLCKILKLVPDLWSLHEWAIWRSPINSTRKFDTIYFFVALDEQPRLLLEQSEVEEALWQTPSDFLRLYTEKSIWLPPNIFYEISRLAKVRQLDDLVSFSLRRTNRGSTVLMPFYYRCSDGLVGTLPGDDYYPLNVTANNNTMFEKLSVAEFCKKADRLHRFVLSGMYETYVIINIPALDGHIPPLTQILSKI